MLTDFNEDFASLADYARMYRELGLQAVPSHYPTRHVHNWKRPALDGWRDYQNELVDDVTFHKWFDGISDTKNNIGILTGNCSGRVFVVDLDTHSKPEAALWWSCCMDMQEKADELESPTQRTGGGGLQILFRAPEGWTSPTIKTSIGVDIRGVGGFIVAAPSMHESGTRYQWIEDKEPWNLEIAEAPRWLCEQIDLLAEQHGGSTHAGPHVKTATPDHLHDAWGALKDGREDYMFRMIWARLVDIARDCPIKPSDEELIKQRDDLFSIYLGKVESRLPGLSESKEAALEKEGRGITEFKAKWRASIKDWDKIIEAAKEPKPNQKPTKSFADQISEGVAENTDNKTQPEESEDWDAPAHKFSVADPKTSSNLFEVLSVDDIFNLPDPVFLIQDLIIEGATAFIYGAPGCGKTFIAMDMAFSLGVDEITHWFGKKINRHGPIVYISSEGTTDMKFRMMAWEKAKKVQINRKRFHFIRQPVNFMDPAHIVKLIQTIKIEVENKCGEKPVMIIIDTVSRVLPGADENLQKDMTLYIQANDAMRLAFDCSATGAHHVSKGNGKALRGSNVLEGAANCAIFVEREKPGMFGTMTMMKIKEARDGWDLPFELRDIDLGCGRSSLVALPVDPATVTPQKPEDASAGDFGGVQETGNEPDMETCRKMVSAIDAAWRGGYPWSRDKKSRDTDRYAPDRLSDMFNLSVNVCEKYVNMWHRSDVIVTDLWGDKSNKKGLRIGKGL
jgi:hypothetical protein